MSKISIQQLQKMKEAGEKISMVTAYDYSQAVHSSNRLIKEGGCDAVKLEGPHPDIIRGIVDAGIAVQGHLGLTSQAAVLLGGFKVQGNGRDAALKLLDDVVRVEEAGAFSIVLECVPEEIGRVLSKVVSIPVIVIGAGRYCDRQILVFHDMLGLFDRFTARFVKQYRQVGKEKRGTLLNSKPISRTGNSPWRSTPLQVFQARMLMPS